MNAKKQSKEKKRKENTRVKDVRHRAFARSYRRVAML